MQTSVSRVSHQCSEAGTTRSRGCLLIFAPLVCAETDFISVEVESYTDLRELESEEAVKREGRLQQQGRKYIVQNGDICFFKFRLPGYKRGAQQR